MSTFVSILMPCYNAERYLEEAVQSVLAQTHRDFELLAIDDGSKDRTREILESFAAKDDRVRVISHPNMGMGRALNNAMNLAKAEWIARIDADDVMLPNRLEHQLDFLEKNPKLVVASSLVEYLDENSKIIGRNNSDYVNPAKVAEALATHNVLGFHHPAVMMRKSVIQSLGGYRHEFWPADDADLWNRVVEKYPDGVIVQPEYLVRYRIHGGSVCVAKSRTTSQKVEWVHACIKARRTNKPEPTWEEFLAEERNQPLLARFNRLRRDYARTWYKAAVFHYSRKKLLRFAPNILAAMVVEPEYVLPRLLPQWSHWFGGRRAESC